MTAQEWLDELERLREAATPGPWKHNIEPRRDGMGFIWPFSSIESEDAKAIEDEEENVTDSITRADAAYIVAACNAVPRLVEMVQAMSSVIAGMPGMESTPDEILQDFFEVHGAERMITTEELARIRSAAIGDMLGDSKELDKLGPAAIIFRLCRELERLDREADWLAKAAEAGGCSNSRVCSFCPNGYENRCYGKDMRTAARDAVEEGEEPCPKN